MEVDSSDLCLNIFSGPKEQRVQKVRRAKLTFKPWAKLAKASAKAANNKNKAAGSTKSATSSVRSQPLKTPLLVQGASQPKLVKPSLDNAKKTINQSFAKSNATLSKQFVKPNLVPTNTSKVGKSILKPVVRSKQQTSLLESNDDKVTPVSPAGGSGVSKSNVPKLKDNKARTKGLGLPKKNIKSKTVSFENDEGDSGIDVETEKQPHKRPSSNISSSLFGNNPEIPDFATRAVVPISESVFSTQNFKDLPIHEFMVSNLEQNLSLTKLTTVQQKSIPVILSGSDALIRSQTGSGKTLAYALPIIEALQKIRPKLPRAAGIQAIVVVPTRELGLQTYELFLKLVKPFTWLVPGYLVGGEKRKSEKARLRKGITVLIGTPGRILDHVTNTKVMIIDSVKWLVLDEADRLLDMGYEKAISSLVTAIDEQAAKNPDIFKLNEDNEPTVIKRQTILVSATLTSGVERLAGLALKTPTYVDAATDGSSLETVDDKDSDISIPKSLKQYYMITPAKLRLVSLCGFIVSKCQFSNQKKMLIFMATQDMVDFHCELLSSVLGSAAEKEDDDYDDDEAATDEGIVDVEFFKLHGSMSQKDRTDCFKTFRNASSGVLLCTDVAARGLDLPHIDWIVQYTAPCSVADYVHRVGRTARVGVAGSALIFLTTTEVEFVRQLEDRRIRLQEEKMDKCLESLRVFSQALGSTQRAPTVESAATALQLRFEQAVMGRKHMHGQACKAYISFVRFYASYPKEGRQIFSFKNLHLGHYAKCFALRDPPSSINGIGRTKWQDDSAARNQKPRYTTSGPNKGRTQKPMRTGSSGQSRSKELVISEYSSGMPARKKRKTE